MDYPIRTDNVNKVRGQAIQLFKCIANFRLRFWSGNKAVPEELMWLTVVNTRLYECRTKYMYMHKIGSIKWFHFIYFIFLNFLLLLLLLSRLSKTFQWGNFYVEPFDNRMVKLEKYRHEQSASSFLSVIQDVYACRHVLRKNKDIPSNFRN